MARDWDRSTVEELLRVATPSRVAETLGLALVKRGSNLQCICPFHDDHDPSLVLYDVGVNRPPNHHCYVCGADGDVFDLVRQVRQCSFVDSVEWLRQTFGLPVRRARLASTNKGSKKPKLWNGTSASAYENAAQIYQSTRSGKQLKKWLLTRKLPETLVNSAELSYSNGKALIEFLKASERDVVDGRITVAMLEDVGLVKRILQSSDSADFFATTESRYRDFFSDERIIFPLRSLDGEIVGFAGRSAAESSKRQPKYLYSPGLPRASLLYRGNVALEKLRILAKEGKPKELFICEGIIDALRVELSGRPAVSILGAQVSENQISELQRISDAVAPAGDLKTFIFLDRDKAGIQGASKLALALAERGFDAGYIWPTEGQLDVFGVPSSERKDPDSLLAALGDSWDNDFISDIAHPTALAVICAKQYPQSTPDDILNDEVWQATSLGVRYRAAHNLVRDNSTANFLLNTGVRRRKIYQHDWYADILNLRLSNQGAKLIQERGKSIDFIAKENARLNVARALAKSGADRGEVPTDEAAWRRLDSGATAFNLGFQERLHQRTFEPMEPFDAVHVARDFEKTEPRLKAMPCPEDLVIQQYMLIETLTERFDTNDLSSSFSRCIPAVRYYRAQKTTETTAEDRTFEVKSETLSFAYQLDMDVLEGRAKASNQGMFRPYIECWREFISTLKRKTSGFDEVFAVRLDLKRYYDRLHRTTVRDSLKVPLDAAFQRLQNSGRLEEFAPSFQIDRQSLSDSVADWFCDQSFDFEYYHPETGARNSSEQGLGIPQGPVLSAWLATIALFPLDSSLRKVLEEINEDIGVQHVAYARYVDDIFLVADSQVLLARLRSAVEDACSRLRLEAIPKGDMALQMTSSEFRELLTEGKALFGSGPTTEIGLLPLGDGEAGYETWQETIERGSALELLNDRRLYEADTDAIKTQVYTALNAHDLRPGELPKASRWMWYAVAREKHQTVEAVWHSYWKIWKELTSRLEPRIKVSGRPWHDPSVYALDGLERLLSSSTAYDKFLSRTAEEDRAECLARLSGIVLQDGFFSEFVLAKQGAPIDAGKGVRTLRRMFLQRSVGIRWIARQLTGLVSSVPLLTELEPFMDSYSETLRSSLARALITDADGSGFPLSLRADDGRSRKAPSALRPLFIWLHQAIVLFGRVSNLNEDQLAPIQGALEQPFEASASDFYLVLRLWLPDLPCEEAVASTLRVDALATVLAVCPIESLVQCLTRRAHLLADIGQPLPALPGVSVDHLVLAKAISEPVVELRQLKRLFATNVPPPTALHRLATASSVTSVALDWKPEALEIRKGTGAELEARLAGQSADWLNRAKRLVFTQPVRTESANSHDLVWAADCYEALARINYDLEVEASNVSAAEVMEFAPAWPYIATSSWSKELGEDERLFSLVGPIVPRSSLANFAFARDGRGRLRSYEVPLIDARLWRIGFAVTDFLGMSGELERFQLLEEKSTPSKEGTAQYVLSRLMARLRGDTYLNAPGAPHPEHPHLTGTTHRAVTLLRNFPTGGKPLEELLYLLAVEAETVAMKLKMTGHADNARPGILTSLLESVAHATFLRVGERQVSHLPKMSIEDGPKGMERRSVAAWRLVDRRLGALEDRVNYEGEPTKYAWAALRLGVQIAAVTAWVRSLVLEIQTANDAPLPTSASVPIEWVLEREALFLGDENKSIGEIFAHALAPEGNFSSLSKVTPLGWLTLLAWQLNIYGNAASQPLMPVAKSEELAPLLTNLAIWLSTTCPDDELSEVDWPFEAKSQFSAIMNEADFDNATSLLSELQLHLGYRVTPAHAPVWGLQPHSKTFTDNNGRIWKLTKTLVDQTARDRYIEKLDSLEDSHRIWTETRNQLGRLIGVSVLGLTFSQTVGMHQSAISQDEGEASPGALAREEALSDDVLGDSATTGIVRADLSTDADIPKKDVVFDDRHEADSSRGFLRSWKELQIREWRGRRRGRSAGHLRFAIFQFKIDDSYYHPLHDAGFPASIDRQFCSEEEIKLLNSRALADLKDGLPADNTKGGTTLAQRAKACLSHAGTESNWSSAQLLPSWNEHRRRKLISEAIRACDAFGVNHLVLPEYSVRPDTIAWLKEHLVEVGSKVAIVAGTYRLHGNSQDVYFKEQFENIFGLSDHQRVFNSEGRSTEKSAYITLLQPVEGRDLVSIFSRRKKYHSMAMNELINPSQEEWAPLLTLDNLVHSINAHNAREKIAPLDVSAILALSRKLLAAERTAELICSELFASTHPVNHASILLEYQMLLQRFGETRVDFKSSPVSKDIASFTDWLGQGERVDRRTILVVPACTTRSADYWIYGQSALLAAGLTTIFCAAVLEDGKGLEGGGSCVIGKSSWVGAFDKVGKPTSNTPYSGWSRGIYYNRPSDALTSKEQALVVVDVDPIYMNEGKPRPQVLAAPIKLVAHLPVVEMVDQLALEAAYTPSNGALGESGLTSGRLPQGLHDAAKVRGAYQDVGEFLNVASASRLVSASHQLRSGVSLSDAAGRMADMFSDSSGWLSRLDCWKRNWRELPFYGAPPTLVDWLAVDLTPEHELARVFVPPWSDDGSPHEALRRT